MGLALGLLIAFNVGTIEPFLEHTFGFQIFDSDVYYITTIPSDVRWPNIITIAIGGVPAHRHCDVISGHPRIAHPTRRSAAVRVSHGEPYEWLIGTRYLRSTHRRGFVSFVAVVSVLGLALGVATLIVVLSVMNGFQREIRSRILSVSSHATMMGLEGNLSNWQTVQREVLKQPGVVAAAPYIEEQAMLANGAHIDGAVVRGILPEQEKTADGLSQRVTEGTFSDLKAGEYNTILGKALAKDLNVHVGGTRSPDRSRRNRHTNRCRSPHAPFYRGRNRRIRHL